MLIPVVVPIYFLVWYNVMVAVSVKLLVVVPIYFLVWYNRHSYQEDVAQL